MKHEPNLSTLDRGVRAAVAVVLVIAALAFRGWLGIVLAIPGALLALNAATGFCHVYKVCGIRTLKRS